MPGGADSAAAAPDAAYEPPQVSRGRCGPSHAPLYISLVIIRTQHTGGRANGFTARGYCRWMPRTRRHGWSRIPSEGEGHPPKSLEGQALAPTTLSIGGLEGAHRCNLVGCSCFVDTSIRIICTNTFMRHEFCGCSMVLDIWPVYCRIYTAAETAAALH
jgi:hypothetical protein